MKKINKSDVLTNLLWGAFGVIGGFSYYSKAEYWICAILFLIGILSGYKLVKPLLFQKDA